MRKIVLSVLAAGLLVPSLALAAGPSGGVGPAGTFDFQYHATSGSSPLASPNAIAGTYGLAQFYKQLGVDLKKGTKTCSGLSTTGAALTSTAELVLPKVATVPGDTTFADGFVTNDGTGVVTGMAWFNGYSAAPGLGNAALLNSTNTATAAILCGAKTSGGSAGQCGDGVNCTASELPNVKNPTKNDPTGEGNCANAGNTADPTGTSNQAYLTVFVYPLGGALCTNPSATLADCCHDPNLVIITRSHETFLDTTPQQVFSTVSDQGTGGGSIAIKQ
jgi:hypothetical protein